MYDSEGIVLDSTENANQYNILNSFDVNLALSLVVFYLAVCGIVTAAVAYHNGRSVPLAFFAGFFFGPLGIMTHMIMGESDKDIRKH